MSRLDIWKAVSLAVAGVMTVAMLGCGNQPSGQQEFGEQVFRPAQLRQNAGNMARWTIMVHLAAENSLYRYGFEDMNEMEAGIPDQDVNVLVLFDGVQQGDSGIYKIQRDPQGMNTTLVSPIVDDKNEVIPPAKEIDSGDPAVMQKFVTWAVTNYPAEHYMVDIWDHGDGIFANGARSRCAPNAYTSFGFAYDNHGGHMVLKDLNTALAPAATAAGHPLDILGFDACLMGHLETGYQVKDLVSILVGSEKTEPGPGWEYNLFMSALGKNTAMAPAELASALVDTYGASYLQSGNHVTQAATDLQLLTESVVPAVNQFAGSLRAALSRHKARILEARQNAESYENWDCVDLYHFAQLIEQDAALPAETRNNARTLMQAIEKAVIREYHTGKTITGRSIAGHAIKYGSVANAHGLVIYFPSPDMTYSKKYDDPQEILFASNEPWRAFLKALAGSNTRTGRTV